MGGLWKAEGKQHLWLRVKSDDRRRVKPQQRRGRIGSIKVVPQTKRLSLFNYKDRRFLLHKTALQKVFPHRKEGDTKIYCYRLPRFADGGS